MLARALLYARTLRYLKPSQVAWRLRKKILGSTPPPARIDSTGPPDCAAAQSLRGLLGRLDASRSGEDADALRSGSLRILNTDVDVRNGMPWHDDAMPRLWRYNLHYCTCVRTLAAPNLDAPSDSDRELTYGWMRDWVDNNPPHSGPGWEPFVVASRLLNWSLACAVFGETSADILGSMEQQCVYLQRNLEWDVLANHLLKDLFALVVAGSFLGAESRAGREALDSALPLLERQLAEQILPDGGHYERSAMYHAHVLEDALMAWTALRDKPTWLTDAIARMGDYLAKIRYEDGGIPLFGDAALDGCIAPDVLLGAVQAATEVECAVTSDAGCALPDSGYYTLGGPHGRMMAKAGSPGPAYQLAHAHCDALSYELSLGATRVIVDSGVNEYQAGPWRDYCRSTRAHNTVQLDARDQLEFWGEFRVGRRYRAAVTTWNADAKLTTLTAEHDGFAPYTHERVFALVEGRFWIVIDTVEGSRATVARSFVHFHPDAQVAPDGEVWRAESGAATLTIVPFGADGVQHVRGEDDAIQGWYCPEFGSRVPASVLCIGKTLQPPSTFGYGLFPSREDALTGDEVASLAETIRGGIT
ncbi:MAG: hypothetical protein GY851_25970 [bacterium]|nr:hypothetical protein [bacterium]